MGAGVILYAVDDQGEIVLLLGKEREVLGWKQGSRRWGAFSGRAEAGEAPAQCAAREFVEETCAAIPLDGEDAPTPEAVAERLQAAPVFRRTCVRSTPVPVELVHTSYLCRVAYSDAHAHRFAAVRQQLLDIERVFSEYQGLRKALSHVPKLLLPGFVLATGVVTIDFAVDLERRLLTVEYHDAAAAAPEQLQLVASEEACQESSRLWYAWKALEHQVETRREEAIFRHPAVVLTRHCGRLTAADVRRSYLEKTEVAWWRLADLEVLSQTGDRWRLENFRRYFLDNVAQLGLQIRESLERG